MCQGCVDDGKLTQETFDKIEAFLDKYEWASHGPAHITLDDDNVGDHNLQFCIAMTKAALSRNAQDAPKGYRDGEFFASVNWYEDQGIECLQATLAFLEELLKIPEDER